uniref:Glycine cleavage system H protein n=1 Tax=Setaria digitata TaxID=48799 RepID=A0A915PSZ3_9BILA
MVAYWTRALQRLSSVVISSKSLVIPVHRTIATSQCLFAGRYYTKKHEWILVEGNTAIIGISDFAQASLGDIVYAELPEIGKELHAGDSVGAVESVKAASDIYAPISGIVMERNTEVEKNPSLINKSAFTDGWLYKLRVKNANELKELMNEKDYEAFKKIEEHEAAH